MFFIGIFEAERSRPMAILNMRLVMFPPENLSVALIVILKVHSAWKPSTAKAIQDLHFQLSGCKSGQQTLLGIRKATAFQISSWCRRACGLRAIEDQFLSPQPQNSLLRITVCNQVSKGHSHQREPVRGKNCTHRNFHHFHFLSAENQVSLLRTFLSDPGSESKT